MEACFECGNSTVTAQVRQGRSVLECSLCGALSGAREAVSHVERHREAEQEGIDAAVLHLQRAIARLCGLRIVGCAGGDRDRRTLPFVRWVALDARGFVQLENLSKSLRLCESQLGAPWAVEVEFESTLEFVLRPRAAAATDAALVQKAQDDLHLLARSIERDVRLGWWRHPSAPAAAT
jgi:hypothetical protein